MSKLFGLLQLLAVGKTAYDKVIMYKFVTRSVSILITAVVAAMLVGTLLVGIVYYIYTLQVSEGIEPLEAMLYTGLGLTLLASALVITVVVRAQHLVDDIKQASKEGDTPVISPVLNKVNDVASGFLDGLLQHDKNKNTGAGTASGRKWWVVK